MRPNLRFAISTNGGTNGQSFGPFPLRDCWITNVAQFPKGVGGFVRGIALSIDEARLCIDRGIVRAAAVGGQTAWYGFHHRLHFGHTNLSFNRLCGVV